MIVMKIIVIAMILLMMRGWVREASEPWQFLYNAATPPSSLLITPHRSPVPAPITPM